MKITAIGIDAAFANMGFASVDLVVIGNTVQDVLITGLALVNTEKESGKTVRKSSDTLRRGRILHTALHELIADIGPRLAFAEVPTGSQNAAASHGLGVAVGVLASCPIALIEVSPGEVKRLFTDKKRTVPKTEIMEWAYAKWPDAPWLTLGGKPGARRLNGNEHLADAMATIVAGIKTPEFKQHFALSPALMASQNKRVRIK